MGVLFGSLTSLFIGLSDLFLVSITKRSHIVTVVVMAFVSAGLVGLVGTVFIAGDLTGRDMVLGAGSGVLMAFALVFYFTGIQRSSVGIVAPLIALQMRCGPSSTMSSTGPGRPLSSGSVSVSPSSRCC